ncbi:MAG: hypothetical protein NZ528_16655 [Caldilineales bacterium]|nr:hypothetical protein [Caldilineales bacterium]MDW8316838.1 terpene cyclase/mutase family protein [Anaerolineae bacterium]
MNPTTIRALRSVGRLLLALALLISTLVAAAPTQAHLAAPSDDPHYADIVVDLGDGRVITRRVTFSTPTITGLEALQRSGLNLEVATYSFGSAICAIEGVGCPATNCFCDASRFWSYHFWNNGWQMYMVGASSSTLSSGAVEGWAWGAGDPPPPITAESLAAEATLQWLRGQQAADGSFGNSAGATVDVLLSVVAAGQNPWLWRSGQNRSLLDWLFANGPAYANNSAAAAGKLAVGLVAAGVDPRTFGGMNLVAKINAYYTPATGAFGTTVQDQAWAMLGLAAAAEPVPPAAVARLTSLANADGGWGWTAGMSSDVDSTAVAIQALIAAGEPPTSSAVAGGLAYLRSAQLTNADGGFPASPAQPWGTRSNTNSTAYAVQAILAVGQDPLSAAWAITATHPISYLLGQQLPSGAFVYQDPPANLFATQQAVPALVGKPFPLPGRGVAQRQALRWIAAQQQADGSFAGFNPGATVDAVLAIAATGRDPRSFVVNGNSPMDYLATVANTYANASAAAAGKLTAGVVAGRGNPRSFGGVDLVAKLIGYYDASSGKFGGGSTWDQSWAMLGLAAAGEAVPPAAVTYLTSIQAAGGGWGFSANAGAADVDSTSLALQALAAVKVGRNHPAVAAGLAFLRSQQNEDGGFPGFLGTTDPASTGLALQALAAFHEDPRSLRWRTFVADGSSSRLTAHNPLEALMALQTDAGGFPGFSGPNDPFSTYQAVPGLSGKPFPLRPPSQRIFPLVFKD